MAQRVADQPEAPRHGLGARAGLARLGQAASTYLGVGTVLVGLCVYLGVTEDGFATWDNAVNILEGNAYLLVAAVGLTFVLLVGGFDLSLGGAAALAGVLLWKLTAAGLSTELAIAVIVVGGVVGGTLTNGLLIAKAGLSFLVVTLAMFGILLAIALLLTGGNTMPIEQEGAINTLGAVTRLHDVPYSVLIALGVFAVAVLVLRYTGYGRMVYATGGNPEAARLAGINTTLIRASVYGISVGCAALAGLMVASRTASANPTGTRELALTAGAAVLIGGTTFFGGRGTMLGTLLGVLFLGVVANGIIFKDWDANWETLVTGVVLLLAILIDRIRMGRQEP